MNDDTAGAIGAARQLALRLLESPGAADVADTPAGEPELVVGALPPDLPVEIPLPPAARIVGSHRDRHGTITVLLDVPLLPAEAWASLDEHLTGAGWVRVDGRATGAGVLSPGSADLRQGGTFCRSDTGPALSVRVLASPDRLSEVRLRLLPGRGPCQQIGRPATTRPLIPDLTPPPGSTLVPRFGGGSDRQASATAELVTDLDSSAVAAHYAQQLEHQGWLQRAEEERGSQVWSTWVDRRADEANGYRLLFLSIVGYAGLPPRAGGGSLTEHPQLVQGYLVETRAAWKQNLEW